jgi:hypothetical protein
VAKVSDARIALAALRAGFPADEISTAVAVGIAESDGNPLAIGVNKPHDGFPRTEDHGVWQINSYWNPALFSKYDWRDVDQNAKMAKAVYDAFVRADGEGWRGWASFNGGRYAKYLARGEAAYRGLYRFTLTRYLMNHTGVKSKARLDHGQDVLALQRAIGMAHGDQDGYFGPKTEQALKAFQKRRSLAEDGVAGPMVCKRLGWNWAGPR